MEGYNTRRFGDGERHTHLNWAPIDWNELRREAHELNRKIRGEIEEQKNKADDMINRVMMRISQPFALIKKVYCIN